MANQFLGLDLKLGTNRLGVGQDFKEDYVPYIIEHEKKTADIQKYGNKFDRWFLSWPIAKPSKTPKYKLYSYIVLPDLENDTWTTDFNQAYWDGIFRDLLEIDKAYKQIPIIDIAGYSRMNVLFPKKSLYDPKNYWFIRALVKKTIQEADKTYIPSEKLKTRRYILQGSNEAECPFADVKANPESKRIVGRWHWIVLDQMRKCGLTKHNLKVNVTNGFDLNGDYVRMRTRDMIFAFIDETVDWKTGFTWEKMKKKGLPIQPRNKYGYKQKQFKPNKRDYLIATHNFGGVESLCKSWKRIDPDGKPYTDRISSSFYSRSETNTVGDSDGFKMGDKKGAVQGLWKAALKRAIIETWEKNLSRGRKNGVLIIVHARGGKDGMRIYQLLPGAGKKQYAFYIYCDEYWSADDYNKWAYEAYLELGFKPIKEIPYKGVMEKKYSQKPKPKPDPKPDPKPKPIIIINKDTADTKYPGKEKEDEMSWKVKVWIKQFFAWVISKLKAIYSKNKWFIWGFVIGLILGIVIF